MGHIYRRGTTYWIKYHRNGRAYYESSNSDKHEEALNLLRQKEGDIARGLPVTSKQGQLTFEEARDDFLTDRRLNSRNPVKKVEGKIALHLTPFFGRRRMAQLTTSEVLAYTDRRKKQDAANGTVNRELTILKRMFSLAVKGGRLLHAPYIPLLKERNTRTGFFERDQYVSVIAHLPEVLADVVIFAYVTGWRVNSEVLPLEWRQVDLDTGEVRLDAHTTKNDEGRVFYVNDELRLMLERRHAELRLLQRQGHIIPWVFWRLVADERGGDRLPRRVKAFGKAWKNACKSAGCPGRIPHDLRRTAVRNMVRSGIPERVAMQLTGHKTRSVFERYNVVSEGDLRDAAKKLSQGFTSNVTGVRA